MKNSGSVLLITGPAGSGKSTLANYAAKHGWHLISEDTYWVKHGWGSGLRSLDQEKVIQQEVFDELITIVSKGKNVVLEFILYYPSGPNPLTAYLNLLKEQKVEFQVVALKPSVEEIMRRLNERGRPNDINNLESRRKDAEHQIKCLEADYIEHLWVIDPTDVPVEELYEMAVSKPKES